MSSLKPDHFGFRRALTIVTASTGIVTASSFENALVNPQEHCQSSLNTFVFESAPVTQHRLWGILTYTNIAHITAVL